MLTPEYLMSVADDVVELYSEVENEIVADIARRIVKTGQLTPTAEWQIQKLRQWNYLGNDIDKTLAKATGMSEKEIIRTLGDAMQKGIGFDNAIYKAAGLHPLAIADSPALKAIALQGTSDTLQLMSNFTKTTAEASKLAYGNMVDQAYLKIMSGSFSPSSAIKEAVDEIARNNIQSVAYPSGATSSLEASVRRAVTTGVNQSVAKLQLAQAADMECELVETSSHAGARPSHAEWQGQVFCIKGYHKHYGDFYRETGYGSGEGLCGWNCYHSFYPYYEGLSQRSFSEDPAKEYLGKDNDLMYEQQQTQRSYERQIRQAKKECQTYSAALNAAKDPDLQEQLEKQLLRSSDKLRARETKLNQFLAQTGRTKEPERVQIGGWNRNEMTTSKSKLKR